MAVAAALALLAAVVARAGCSLAGEPVARLAEAPDELTLLQAHAAKRRGFGDDAASGIIFTEGDRDRAVGAADGAVDGAVDDMVDEEVDVGIDSALWRNKLSRVGYGPYDTKSSPGTPWTAMIEDVAGDLASSGISFVKALTDDAVDIQPRNPQPIVDINASCVFMPDRGNFNIYHYMIYMLGNLRHILSTPQTVIVRLEPEQPFQRELLRMIYPKAEVKFVQPIPQGCKSVPQDYPAPFPQPVRDGPGMYNFLRAKLLPAISPQPPDRRGRVYVSRRHAEKRRVGNEDELMGALARIRFQKLELEGLRAVEQMRRFSGAQAVVAPHGAGLVNLIAGPPSCVVVELGHPLLLHFQDIAKHLGMRYSLVHAMETEKVEEMTVNVGDVLHVVSAALGEQAPALPSLSPPLAQPSPIPPGPPRAPPSPSPAQALVPPSPPPQWPLR